MTIDTFIGLGGIFLAVALYYFDLKKKLDNLQENINQILINQEGILSKQQAHDLIDLYLDAVEAHIELYLTRYARNDLIKHYEARDIASIRNEFERAYEQIVKKSLRKMVASFRVRGGHRIEEIIGKISQEQIVKSMDSIIGRFENAGNKNLTLEKVIPDALLIVRKVNLTGKAFIIS